VNVSITIEQDVPATFPAVTICNLNPFDNDDPDISNTIEAALLSSNFTDNGIPIDIVEKRLRVLKIESKKRTLENIQMEMSGNNQNKIKNYDIGYKINLMLLSCKFDDVECFASDFVSYYSYEYGNCFIFNTASNNSNLRTVTRTKVGLRMELFTGIPGKLKMLSK
jgi:hypothetical protein